MKGTVAVCLKEMVQKRGGRTAWEQVLAGAGYEPSQLFTMGEDVPDERCTALMGAAQQVLGLDGQGILDAFAHYWMCDFGPRVYVAFYDGKKNAKEFLLAMDNVHIVVTNTMTNARPPRFRCELPDERTMIMHYASPRGMVDLMIAFIKGVGAYYKEALQITKLGPDRVQIVFGG
jgi:methyl-accepting chemotaxis protein